jgi:hypothetical protein
LDTPPQCCALIAGDVSIVKPTTLCKAGQQLCCIHCGIALPPDDDIAPCTLAALGWVCCYKWTMPCSCCELRENLEANMTKD